MWVEHDAFLQGHTCVCLSLSHLQYEIILAKSSRKNLPFSLCLWCAGHPDRCFHTWTHLLFQIIFKRETILILQIKKSYSGFSSDHINLSPFLKKASQLIGTYRQGWEVWSRDERVKVKSVSSISLPIIWRRVA